MSDTPQHILVIHVAGLAQTTLALPALRSLRAHLPNSRITVATSSAAADLIRLSGCADEVLTIGRLHHAELFKPTVFYRSTKAVNELRHANYDLAIEFKTGTEAGIVLNLANPRERLKPLRDSNKSLSNVIERVTQAISRQSPLAALSAAPIHLAHQYLKKLEPLGVRPIEAEPRITTDRQADEQIEKLLKKHGAGFGELLVGIHPGAGQIRHRWPVERFVSVGARMINNFNARVLVFAGPQERGLAKQIVKQLSGKGTGKGVEKGSVKRAIAIESPKLPELVSAFARLSLLIANHSGPAHLAAAVGAPVVVISTLGSTFGKDSTPSPTDVLGSRREMLRASHVELISEEAVYEAACRLLKMNRAEYLRSR
ncbi:MAG: glycosyltransferase family 9 protein [Acidobacteriota bacterium]